MNEMTIEELEMWAKAAEKVARRRARLEYSAVSAALNGGKSFEEFRRMTDDK